MFAPPSETEEAFRYVPDQEIHQLLGFDTPSPQAVRRQVLSATQT